MNRKLAALGAACALACAALPAVTWANGYSGGSGVAIPPMVTNPAQRVTTYTAITGAGSQMICPAITAIGQAVVAEEVSVSVGGRARPGGSKPFRSHAKYSGRLPP